MISPSKAAKAVTKQEAKGVGDFSIRALPLHILHEVIEPIVQAKTHHAPFASSKALGLQSRRSLSTAGIRILV